MKLNKVLLTSTVFFQLIILRTSAQEVAKDSTIRKFYYEQGFNCSQFVKQYLSFNESFATNMPYLLTGNIGFKNIGLRYGTNYQISNSKSSSSGSSSSSSSGSTINPPEVNNLNSVVIDNRIGFYYRKTYFKKLNLNIGLDFLISNSIIKTKTESTQNSGFVSTTSKSDTKTNINSKGYGPCLALNYRVWRSISIGTEAALYYISGSSKQEGSSFTSETPNTPFSTYSYFTQETSSKATFSETQIRIPLTLFVYFKF